MLQHSENTQGGCSSILERMPRHWNRYEKSMPQHAITDAIACGERRKWKKNTRDFECRGIRGIRELDVKASKKACRGIQ